MQPQSEDSNKKASTGRGGAYLVWRLCLVGAVLALIWIPHLTHFDIDRSPTELEVLKSSLRTPSREVLDEIGRMPLGTGLTFADDKIIETAEQIFAGAMPAPRFLKPPLPLQGYPQDYRSGPQGLQLSVAALEIEGVLVRAFERTHDRRFLQLAIKRILNFAEHESRQRLADGFLWNDHAVGARISVLVKVWRYVREDGNYPSSTLREILSLIERSGRLLAKPEQFTVKTNHGVVQNLALLQICAAFPALPEVAAWRETAVRRLTDQLHFYVSPEGVVLEHSAEYQRFGTELLANAIRLVRFNGMEPAPILAEAAHNTGLVLSNLVRPDGTLPLVGNTSAGKYVAPSLPNRVTYASDLFPVAGYAIWWQRDKATNASQTVVTWAKHDGHGHKHADEGSVLFWSDGVDWITNTGYWPYGAPNEEKAYSWSGSNAAHQPGEPFHVARSAQLLMTGEATSARFIEVERRNQSGEQFRRQVVRLDAQTLLVLDFVKAVPNGTETVWTIDPRLQLMPGESANSFISSATPDGRQVSIAYASQLEAKLQLRRGSERPFAGWVVVDNQPTVADALQIIAPIGNTSSAILFSVSRSPIKTAAELDMPSGATAERWTVVLHIDEKYLRVRRQGENIAVETSADSQVWAPSLGMALARSPDVTVERAALKTAYAKAVNTYPPWRDLSFYRLRLTYVLGILAVLIEVGWLALSTRPGIAGGRKSLYVHWAISGCWAAAAVWISQIYLK